MRRAGWLGDPAVACNDHTIVADQHRIDETKLGDRSRNLRHLLFGMCAGVACMRDQSLERPSLDRIRQLGFHMGLVAVTWSQVATSDPVTIDVITLRSSSRMQEM